MNAYRIHASIDPTDAGPRRWVRKYQTAAVPPPRSPARQSADLGLLAAAAAVELERAIANGKASRPVMFDIGVAQGIPCPCQKAAMPDADSKSHATRHATDSSTSGSPHPSSQVHATDISDARACLPTQAAGIAQETPHKPRGTRTRTIDCDATTAILAQSKGQGGGHPPLKGFRKPDHPVRAASLDGKT